VKKIEPQQVMKKWIKQLSDFFFIFVRYENVDR